jgi:serine/threonine protein kinase
MRHVLKASGISKEESTANPQAVLDVLSFHMEGGPKPKELPTQESSDKLISEAANIRQEDYKTMYSGMKQLGQGASGIVYSATCNSTGRKVALKLAPIADLRHLMNEMGLQSLSKHNNIVQYNEVDFSYL